MGVWRDHFRVRVSIPIDSPLKRRTKLRKSETEWCWVYFKYEAVLTFCFICGLIGHSDKFCDKLFDVQGSDIEKPYGAWMRADPKRCSYTMRNKWLRAGGAAPVNTTTEEDGDKSMAMISATANKNSGKLGITTETTSIDSRVAVAVNLGVTGGVQDKNKKLAIISRDNEYIEKEFFLGK